MADGLSYGNKAVSWSYLRTRRDKHYLWYPDCADGPYPDGRSLANDYIESWTRRFRG